MTIAISKLSNKVVTGALVAVLSTATLLPQIALAGQLNNVEVRFDRMSASTATTGTVCANIIAASGTEAAVDVTFPAGYTVSTNTANWATSTSNLAWPTGASAWPGMGTASAVAGQVVTFPSGNITSDGVYCFNWTNNAGVTTAASPANDLTGKVETKTSAPAVIDSGNYATSVVSSDQILVTASVSETFSFALSGTTDNLGVLSTSSVVSSPTPRTATISTNAKFGWQLWAKDSATGLNSASKAYTIASTTPGTNSTISGATEGYNMGVTSSQVGGSGTITVAPAFVGGVTGKGGGLNTSFQTVATSNGTANNSVLTMTNNASISPLTPASGDYQDTLTIVAAGLF